LLVGPSRYPFLEVNPSEHLAEESDYEGINGCSSNGGSRVRVIGPQTIAQTTPPPESTPHVISNQDLDLLRKDMRSKRRQLIAANLTLTDTEATKFWPVYDQYVSELVVINDRKFGLIQEYADSWGKPTDEQCLSFIRRWLDADIEIAQLRQRYVPIVSKTLDGRKSATFFQLDRRIAMMILIAVIVADAPGANPIVGQ
jgi:hypothetical protein